MNKNNIGVMQLGMLFVVTAILLSRFVPGTNDFVLGLLNGLGGSLIVFGLFRYGKRKSAQ